MTDEIEMTTFPASPNPEINVCKTPLEKGNSSSLKINDVSKKALSNPFEAIGMSLRNHVILPLIGVAKKAYSAIQQHVYEPINESYRNKKLFKDLDIKNTAGLEQKIAAGLKKEGPPIGFEEFRRSIFKEYRNTLTNEKIEDLWMNSRHGEAFARKAISKEIKKATVTTFRDFEKNVRVEMKIWSPWSVSIEKMLQDSWKESFTEG